MAAENPITETFAGVLREAGFGGKSPTWYREAPEVIAVVNLQRLNPGLGAPAEYGYNLGFWLRELGDETHPKVDDCHVYEPGWPQWTGTAKEREIKSLRRFLDLGTEIPDEERQTHLRKWVEQRLLPHLERGSSVAGLRAMEKKGMLGPLIRNEACDLLTRS